MPQVKLYANLRKLAGTKELSTTGPSLRVVLSEVAKQHPAVGSAILENGDPRPHVVIMVNGYNAATLDMPVNEQDIIAIFPPIAGG